MLWIIGRPAVIVMTDRGRFQVEPEKWLPHPRKVVGMQINNVLSLLCIDAVYFAFFHVCNISFRSKINSGAIASRLGSSIVAPKDNEKHPLAKDVRINCEQELSLVF